VLHPSAKADAPRPVISVEIVLENLTKRFDSVVAVDGIDLSVASGEFVALLGPSGCGKTTTLLTIAGIYRPTEGRVLFDGRDVSRLAPRERNLGMVFQSYALYPHMSVYENLTFPLRLAKVPAREMRARADRIAALLDISELMDRRPGQLSGGQQQRVALGRALIKEPDALLFDEPLSNLDARLRLTTRTEIKRLQQELGITSVFVTHDQTEAMTMADRIAVINRGRLESYASPDDTYNRPRTRFVAGFVGNPPMNFLEVELSATGEGFVARRAGVELPVCADRARRALERGGDRRVVLGVRPEDVALGGEGVPGEVIDVEPLGRENLVVVSIGEGDQLRAITGAGTRLAVGDRLSLTIDPQRVQLFDPSSGRSLLWS
jgi:inositol-phosphate transport system ATP-binding protein